MNGVFRGGQPPAGAMPTLDARLLDGHTRFLEELGRVLGFPDYYGANWDALEECLTDLSWHDGALHLLITHSDVLAEESRAILVDVFLQAARYWSARGRAFSLYLA